MERTESTVIQVAPDYENARIKEMENFGWSLQGRQEIHEEGEAYGRPSYLSDSTYVIKTKVSHYVKLHFIRSHGLPGLAQIRQLESQYFELPFPAVPVLKSFIWPVVLILMGLASVTNPDTGTGVFGLVVFGGLGAWWLYSKIQKRQRNTAVCMDSVRRQGEIIGQTRQIA